jgi:hypothetical protein
MQKRILFFFQILIVPALMAQGSHGPKLRVADATSRQAIPFATVRSTDFTIGTYADSAGYFILNGLFIDSLCVSSIGYTAKTIAIKDIPATTIYLVPQVTELEPVLIKKWKTAATQVLGITKGKMSTAWTSGGFGEEFAQRIDFPDTTKVYRIQTISIGAERFDETIPMILHIYTMDAAGFPKDDLLTKKIILRGEHFKRSSKKLVVDLGAENILIHEAHCFVGVEWLPVSAQGQRLPSTALTLTADRPERLSFSRVFSSRDYKWMYAPANPAQVNPNNTIISVSVDVLE